MAKKNSNSRTKFGAETIAFVDQFSARGIPEQDAVALKTLVAEDVEKKRTRAFHAILLTADAFGGAENLKRETRTRIPAPILELTKSGVRVFLLTTEKFNDLADIHQIVLQSNAGAQHPRVVEEILGAGIKFDNLLVAVDCSNHALAMHIELLFKLQDRVIPAAALRTGRLLLPYTTDGDKKHLKNKVAFLPIVRSGILTTHVEAVKHLVGQVLLVRPLNLTELSRLVQDGSILDDFVAIANLATANKKIGLTTLRRRAARLKEPSTEVFDDRSGAVFFRPDDWRAVANGGTKLPEVRDYFVEKLPEYWQDDRPCFRRILFTPTKVLLRGEQYYTNMRNESPFLRLERMATEMSEIGQLITRTGLDEGEDLDLHDWKLVLGLLDQVRNISLQLFSFAHASIRIFSSGADESVASEMTALLGDRLKGVNGLLFASVATYYAWIFADYKQAAKWSRDINSLWTSIEKRFKAARQLAKDRAKLAQRPLGDLVRRWREADHPGENLLTALIAHQQLRSLGVRHVVGIGWGGIELPLVYQAVCEGGKKPQDNSIKVHIAQFSHYRGGTRNNEVMWMQFPESGEELDVDGQIVALFDDNTLTGYTLERVRDDLLLRGAKEVTLFVTRYSGERRYAHMRMAEHGVIDPAELRDHVGGYIGETPFARSWSAKPKDYKSPIGVFSLARRRILECIHNNSTVQLYDREGF